MRVFYYWRNSRNLFSKGLFVEGGYGVTHQDLVNVPEGSDYRCTLQGIEVQSCTAGRLAFTEEAQTAFDKFLSSGFYIFLPPLGKVQEIVWSSRPTVLLLFCDTLWEVLHFCNSFYY